MKRRRHTPEQVVRKLREGDKLLGEGKTVPEVARVLEVSENTFHRWRNQVRRDEGHRHEAPLGAGARECAAQGDRR